MQRDVNRSVDRNAKYNFLSIDLSIENGLAGCGM